MSKKKFAKYAFGGQYNADAGMFGKENMFAQGNPAAAGISMMTGFLPENREMNDFAFARTGSQIGSLAGPVGAVAGAGVGLIADKIAGDAQMKKDNQRTFDMNKMAAEDAFNPYTDPENGYKQVDPRMMMAEGGPINPPSRNEMYNDSLTLYQYGEKSKAALRDNDHFFSTKRTYDQFISPGDTKKAEDATKRLTAANGKPPRPISTDTYHSLIDYAHIYGYKKPIAPSPSTKSVDTTIPSHPRSTEPKKKSATRSDSLALYDNSKKVLDYYATSKNGKYRQESKMVGPTMGVHRDNDRALEAFEESGEFLDMSGMKEVPRNSDRELYRQDIDSHRYKQRETANSRLDLDAPMQLFHRSINPTLVANYDNPSTGDKVSMFGYDPISVKPWDMLSDAERATRTKTYGDAGAPKGQKSAPAAKAREKGPEKMASISYTPGEMDKQPVAASAPPRPEPIPGGKPFTAGFMDPRVAGSSTIVSGANRQMSSEAKPQRKNQDMRLPGLAEGGNVGGHVIPAENVGMAIQDAARAGRSDVIKPASQNELIGGVIPGAGHPKADDKLMKPGGGDPIKISSGEMYVNDEVFGQMASARGLDPVAYGQMMYPNGITDPVTGMKHGGCMPKHAEGGPTEPPTPSAAPSFNSIGRAGGSRSWRNNNPGNLEYNDYTKKLGATGSDGRFAIFPDLELGTKAQERTLFEGKNYRNLTMDEAIRRWAPASENDTVSYARKMGGDPLRKMSEYTPEERSALLARMREIEGWKEGTMKEPVVDVDLGEPAAFEAPSPYKIMGPTVETPTLAAPPPEVPAPMVEEDMGDQSMYVPQSQQVAPQSAGQPVSYGGPDNTVAIASLRKGGKIPRYAAGGPTGGLYPGASPNPYPWTPQWLQESAYGDMSKIGPDGQMELGPYQLPDSNIQSAPGTLAANGNRGAEFMYNKFLGPNQGQGQPGGTAGAGAVPPLAKINFGTGENADSMNPPPNNELMTDMYNADNSVFPKNAADSIMAKNNTPTPGSDEPGYDWDAMRTRINSMMWGQLPFHVGAALYNIGTGRQESPRPVPIRSESVDYNTDAYASELNRQRQDTNANVRYNLKGKSGVGASLVAGEIDNNARRRNAGEIQRLEMDESVRNTGIRNQDTARNIGAINEWNRYESASEDRDRAMRGQALGQNVTSMLGTLGTRSQNELYLDMGENREQWNKWAREEIRKDPLRAISLFNQVAFMNP